MDTNQFPEIAKAVGAHKYLKRVPRPGGGYRYEYETPKGRPSAGVRAIADLLQRAINANERGDKNTAKTLIKRARGVKVAHPQAKQIKSEIDAADKEIE